MEQRLKDFDIKFIGLKLGIHQFDYQLDNSFFQLFDYADFEGSDLKAQITIEKKNSLMEILLKVDGKVQLPCDLTMELFWMELSEELELVVKFGEEYDDSEEDVLILPHQEHQMNLAQYLYEMTVLAIPQKRVHPDVESGNMGQEMLAKLEELKPDSTVQTKEEDDETDPRWDQLKSLLK